MNYDDVLKSIVTYKGHNIPLINFVDRFCNAHDSYEREPYAFTNNTKFYINILHKHKKLKFFLSYNRSFFALNYLFSNFIWLVYRKMYRVCALWACMLMTLSLIALIIFININANSFCLNYGYLIIASLIVAYGFLSFMLPFAGNYIYMSNIARDIINNKPYDHVNTNLWLPGILCVALGSTAIYKAYQEFETIYAECQNIYKIVFQPFSTIKF